MKPSLTLAFIVICLLTAVSLAPAQVELKPGLGLTFTDLSKDPSDGSFSGRVGYQFGGSVLLGVRAYFEGGFFYTRKSTEFTEASTNVTFDNHFDGIRIPVMVGYHLLGDEKDLFALRAFGGGSMYMITKVNVPGATKDDFTSPTYGVFAGAGADVFMFFVDLKYEWSLSDVSKLSTVDIGKKRSFIANAGVRLAF